MFFSEETLKKQENPCQQNISLWDVKEIKFEISSYRNVHVKKRSMIRVMFSTPPFTTSLTCKPKLNPDNSLATVNPIYRIWACEELRDKSRWRSILAGETNLGITCQFSISTLQRQWCSQKSDVQYFTETPAHTITSKYPFWQLLNHSKTFFLLGHTAKWVRNLLPWYKTYNDKKEQCIKDSHASWTPGLSLNSNT